MKVILLCAGYATRLYPLTENQPKPLLPIGGRPILEWILDKLQEAPSLEHVYIVSNHKFAGHFQVWQKSFSYICPITVVDDKTLSNDDRLGAIGDLKYVIETQKIKDEDLLVIAGDNYFDFDLKGFTLAAQTKRPHGVIAAYDVKDKVLAKQYGLIACDKSGKISEFFEKPENPPTTLASCGLYWLPGETMVLLDRYLSSGHNSDQPGHYMRWLAETDNLFAIPLEGRWLDIGDRASYDKANAQFSLFQKDPERKSS